MRAKVRKRSQKKKGWDKDAWGSDVNIRNPSKSKVFDGIFAENFVPLQHHRQAIAIMAREDIVQKWLYHVHEDIGAADCLFQSGRWLYVGFLCHQALEKALKAYYVATHDDDPPYTHSHTRLLNICGLTDELTDAQLDFIDLMVPLYIESRYPEQKMQTSQMLNRDACHYILTSTKELAQWIEQRLPKNKPSTSCESTNV